MQSISTEGEQGVIAGVVCVDDEGAVSCKELVVQTWDGERGCEGSSGVVVAGDKPAVGTDRVAELCGVD